MRFRSGHSLCRGAGLLVAVVVVSGTSSAAPLTSSIIDSSGRWVAFSSDVEGLAPGHGAGSVDVYVRDSRAGTTELISVIPDGLARKLRHQLPAIDERRRKTRRL